MSGANLTLFVAASLSHIVAPGPDTLYVLARGIGRGKRAGIISALGTCSGILVHTTLAALGLAYLLGIALPAGTASRLLARPSWQSHSRWLSGSLLAAQGLRLALPEQR